MIWLIPVAAAGLLAAWLWLLRERRAARHRRFLRALFAICEDLFSASSPEEIQRRLGAALPRIAGAGRAAIYLHNQTLDSLDAVDGGPAPSSIRVTAALGEPGGAIAASFRNRTLMPVALPDGGGWQLLIPMLARGAASGVLAVDHAAEWNADRQPAMQHLGNQVATALKLIEQQTIRERLFRSEKLAAAGQLISGVAGELRVPLAAAMNHARLVREGLPEDLKPAMGSIAAECAKASNLVERLISFTDPGAARPEPVELNALLSGLVDFRRQEWRVRGVQCSIAPAPAPVMVAGSESQLQQALLTLLLHAEDSLAPESRTIDVAVSTLGRRALVRVGFASSGTAPESDALQAVHGVLLAHGGDLQRLPGMERGGFDVILPLAETEQAAPASAGSGRRLTALVVDPDPVARREIVRLMGQRRHRAVPCANTEEALDLVERMAFDAVMCAVRQPGASWIELRDRSGGRVEAFVLLTEGAELDASWRLVLQKPVGPSALDSLLARIG